MGLLFFQNKKPFWGVTKKICQKSLPILMERVLETLALVGGVF